ncbi:hypothetical protein ATCCBAA256_19250 [Mycobacterium montefiorense]|nr:hypothetical protein ATCCBAA256_19250 [Mycobacterium montefiorense]
MVTKRSACGCDRVFGAGEQRGQLPARLGEGLHRLDGLVQGVEQVGSRLRKAVRRIDERGHGRGAGVSTDNRIELIEKAIQLPPGIQQGAAAVVGGGTQRGEDPHGSIVAASSGGRQQVAQLADGRLEQHGRKPGVFRNVGARPDRRARALLVSGAYQLHRRHGEHIARHHSGGYGRRNRLGELFFEIDVDVVGFSVGRGNHVVDHPDEHAVILDVRLLRQTVADVDQIGDHPNVVVEPAGGLEQHRDGEQGRDHYHRCAGGKQLPVRGAAPVQLKGVRH